MPKNQGNRFILTCINLFLCNKVIKNHSKFILFFFMYQYFSPSQRNSRNEFLKALFIRSPKCPFKGIFYIVIFFF